MADLKNDSDSGQKASAIKRAEMGKLFVFRKVVQLSILALVFVGVTLKEFETHAVCPFGGVATIYELATTGEYLHKIHPSSMVMLALCVVITLLFGAVFCGWICPFGTVQELVGKVGQKLFPKFYNNIVPERLDKALRFTRYLTLGAILYVTASVGKLVFEAGDPFHAMMNILNSEVSEVFSHGLVFLGVVMVLSLLIERPFCKYACPLGAVIGAFSLFSVFKLRRDPASCIRCGLCDKSCPMNIEISTRETVKNHQCIGCFKCTSGESCPVKETVYLATKAMPANKG